ncbi:MAG: hypothetical protein ABR549_12820 [Mycobacteriales bacterium]
MIDKVIGSFVPLARLPLTLVEGIESVLAQATHVATRAAVIADRAEPIADRIEALLDRAETVPDRIEELLDRSATIAAALQSVVADATTTLAAVKPPVDAGLVQEVVDLLPALRSLEQLVPVVSQLGTQVDNLDRTVADVGALLGGIPGAARLLKRGETTRPAR